MFRLANDEDLDRAQLSQVNVQIKVLEHASDRALKISVHLLIFQACDSHATDARQIDLAVAVDEDASIEIDLSPGANQEFIARSHDVIRRHGNTIDGRERTRHILEKIAAIDREI